MTKELETKIDELLTRGVENVYPTKEALRKELLAGKKLKLYLGIDPTGKDLHLGHAIQLRKLAQFQKLGHKVTLLIGDFTAMIGDPTDKLAQRVPLTREQVLENCKGYKDQAGKVIDFDNKENPVELAFNSGWLSKLNFEDVVQIASYFTVQQMLERSMFQERLKNQKPIGLHEFLYPLMQGYDSVAMDVDLEIGGNDQTFNMLAGRDLLRSIKNKEKFVLTTRLLSDPAGKKMGKTEGNMLTLSDTPENMLGKVMSWSDEMIEGGLEICTDVPKEEIKEILAMGPRDAKLRLAKEIVRIYHGDAEAARAEEYFVNIFSKKSIPDQVPEWVSAYDAHQNVIDFMVSAKLATSRSDARRKIEQGGVSIDGEKVIVGELILTPDLHDGKVMKVGKIHFVKIKFEK
jgi:tyrosyl-tRNA synthetase